jgi:surface antigen
MKNRLLISAVIGLFSALVVFTGVSFATGAANSVADESQVSDIIVAASFDIVNNDSKNLSESINIITNGSNWRVNDAVLPFKKSLMPTRMSQSSWPREEWGEGQFTKIANGNTYVAGQCTWYVFNRRAQQGHPIGTFWGNGGGWHYSAAAAGYIVNHTPEIGAVFEQSGHVAYVEEVGLDNSVLVSEMNYNYVPFNYNERWVAGADGYWYIH